MFKALIVVFALFAAVFAAPAENVEKRAIVSTYGALPYTYSAVPAVSAYSAYPYAYSGYPYASYIGAYPSVRYL
ncbi:hypothetical protein PVAND_005284 [Polypedilum vanderplanki]|uniref:Neuropeptide-like 4 n=1 Tax=Polypedilum vanderplanki TaxID=319348 RepID=A0A9J6BZY1_POLVA|nr:hypothetical protein PVAND_005284 [Polypedilum vanderplanki]